MAPHTPELVRDPCPLSVVFHMWQAMILSGLFRCHLCDVLTALLALSFSFSSQDYISVKQEELRQFLLARLRIFYEEELDVPLVL